MDPRRSIPSVERLLGAPELGALIERAGRVRVTVALRAVQEAVRSSPDGVGAASLEDAGWYAREAEAWLSRTETPALRRVINGTGVVLHTNLGRAPLASSARAAVAEAAGYASLEMELETGSRGSRHQHCVALLRELTGAEDALVVNNNAAAVVLALNTLASGGEALISRGELVEIGGSFRVPEIMERSGARMREVGATNRTHARDYREALGPGVRVALKVHRSNFRVEGYTAEVGVAELAGITAAAGIPLVHDLGSGALLDPSEWGLPPEPTASEALAAGADLVTMSGDKLLGGPQAGIVLGRAALVAALRANPLHRALRCDKLTLAALHATLVLYRDPALARAEIPILRMLAASPAALEARADGLAERIRAAGVAADTAPGMSAVGGGAYPGVELPTTVVRVRGGDPDALARRLRTGDPSVVGRVRDDAVHLDPRTIEAEEEAAVVAAVAAAVAAAVGASPS